MRYIRTVLEVVAIKRCPPLVTASTVHAASVLNVERRLTEPLVTTYTRISVEPAPEKIHGLLGWAAMTLKFAAIVAGILTPDEEASTKSPFDADPRKK